MRDCLLAVPRLSLASLRRKTSACRILAICLHHAIIVPFPQGVPLPQEVVSLSYILIPTAPENENGHSAEALSLSGAEARNATPERD